MGKCAIIHNNLISEVEPELILGTINDGYSMENLTEGRARKFIEFPVISHIRIRFTFSTAKAVSGCAFINHNFPTATTLDCVGGDTVVEVEAATPAMTGNAFGKTSFYTATEASKKIWDFNIYMSGMTGTAYLGELYLGTFANFSKNFNYGYTNKNDGVSISVERGTVYKSVIYESKSLENLSFEFTDAQEEEHRDYFVQDYSIFIPDAEILEGHYGLWLNPYSPTHITFNQHLIQNTFREDGLDA